MADISKTMKDIWAQSVKAVNKAATNIANSTKQKMDEMSMTSRRKELQNQLGAQVYALWQQGEEVPATLHTMLEEMKQLDTQLQELREAQSAPEVPEAPEAPEAPEMPEEPEAPEAPEVPETVVEEEIPTINVAEMLADVHEAAETIAEKTAPTLDVDDNTDAE